MVEYVLSCVILCLLCVDFAVSPPARTYLSLFFNFHHSQLGNLFGFGGDSIIASSKEDDHPDPDAPPPKEVEYYKVPMERANGRPHELGWLDSLNGDKERVILGKVAPGQIIME